MKSINNIIVGIGLALGLVSCASEAPFSDKTEDNNLGRLQKSALQMDVKTVGNPVRSEATPTADDFSIRFFDSSNAVVKVNGNEVNKYKDLPEIILLPVGSYSIEASYGDNKDCAFEEPYYLGNSESFNITNNGLKDDIKPIECKLSNIKVTIVYDQSLLDVMDINRSSVTVHVGDRGALEFKHDETRSGHFRFVDDSETLAAEFTGYINGKEEKLSKTYKDVKMGNHYTITFRVKNADPNGQGSVDIAEENGGGISLSAAVTTVDNEGVSVNINEESEYIKDPDSKDPIVPDDPNNPGDDTPTTGGPTVTACDGISLDDRNVVGDGSLCYLDIHSETGIVDFDVEIDSETLGNALLSGVGLSTKFNLVTGLTAEGKDVTNALRDPAMGLPVGNEVEGKNDVHFDISPFMGLLGIYGTANHDFILTIKDASGTTKVTLKLRTVKE